jgi:8-oxo-dGTP pyrophosphatase MutT (NUDIX family)
MDFRQYIEATKYGLTTPDEEGSQNNPTGYQTNKHTGKTWWAGHGMSAVGILPVIIGTGLIGVAWRDPRVHMGNCYGAIGGATEYSNDEFHSNLEGTIRQELAEEAGYHGPVHNLTHLYTYFDYQPQEHEKTLHDLNPDSFHNGNAKRYWEVFKYYNFAGMVDMPFEVNPEQAHAWETGRIRWLPFEKLAKVKLHPGLKELMSKAGDKLAKYVDAAKRQK